MNAASEPAPAISVLLVDDNPLDRGMVKRELRKEFSSLNIFEATNDDELNQLLDAHPFDLVITDFQIRWTDGLDVLNRIRERRPECPVVMFTATGSEEIAVQAMRAGLDDYVVKNADQMMRLRASVRAAIRHRQMMQRVMRLESDLAHLNRITTMGEMVTVLAHEVNQPLSAISNYASACSQQLKGDVEADPLIRQAIERIEDQARRAGEIVNRLKRFVIPQPARPSPSDLNRLIEEVVVLLEPQTRQEKIEILVQGDGALSAVPVDALQMQQVLVNLLTNAIQAITAFNPRRRQIEIRTARRNAQAEILVADSGPGIAPEMVPTLFQAYATTKIDGLGMGLNISRRLIESHGGTIRLATEKSALGGACFEILLPLA